MDHIIIEGFMGSGKGSVGKKLAASLGVPLVDTDKMIVDRMKTSPAEIYDRFGDIYYRALETYMLGKLVHRKERCVIIVGSGLPLMPQNKDYLQELGKVYYLQADAASIAARLEKNKKKDWLDENDDLKEKVKSLLKEREPGYLSAADVIVKVAKRTVADVVDEILSDVNREDAEAAPAADGKAESAEKEPEAVPKKKTEPKKKAAAKKNEEAAEKTAAAEKNEEAEERPAAAEETVTEEKPKAKKKASSKKAAAKKTQEEASGKEAAEKEASGKEAADKKAPRKKAAQKKAAAKKTEEETSEE